MLYFAYGSNMSRGAMRQRCPQAVAGGRASFRHYRFVIMTSGYASIVPAPGHVVHGVLWKITPRDLAALNAYENVDGGLYRRAYLPVSHDNRNVVTALVYLGLERGEGRPLPGYLEDVIDAAQAWYLPADYIASLRRWSPGSWRGTAAPDTGVLS